MSQVVRSFAVYAALAISLPAQTLTTVYELNGLDGTEPTFGTLIQASNGNLYGTTWAGGQYAWGTIFEFTPGGGPLTTVYSFCSHAGCPDGTNPSGGLVLAANGDLYGTTSGGGASEEGTVFRIKPSGGLTTLHSFNGADGASPAGKLIQTKSGVLYGTTSGGGANGKGTIFSITPDGMLTTLYSFCSSSGCPDGNTPWAGLVQGVNGELYGTTLYGGVNTASCIVGCGTLFEISPTGTLTTLHQFCSKSGCADGAVPYAGLILASDGNLYGTTQYGGANCQSSSGCGTIFKLSSGEPLTTLFSFDDTNGRGPVAALMQATNGNFYGTTEHGGTKVDGTVYEFTPGGVLTNLYNFDDGADGAGPFAGLVQASNGDLYGTTAYGGSGGHGTIFGISGIPPNGVPK